MVNSLRNEIKEVNLQGLKTVNDESSLEDYFNKVQREWDLNKIYNDIREKNSGREGELTDFQKDVLRLMLAGLQQKDIAKFANCLDEIETTAHSVKDCINNKLKLTLSPLIEHKPVKGYRELLPILRSYGYARSNWEWLTQQAILNDKLIEPELRDTHRDWGEVNSPDENKSYVHIVKKGVPLHIRLNFDISPKQEFLLLNQGVSGNYYNFVPSAFSPEYKKGKLPNDHSYGPTGIKFGGVGTERFLAVISQESLGLSWLKETFLSYEKPQKLKEDNIKELARRVQSLGEKVRLFYTKFLIEP